MAAGDAAENRWPGTGMPLGILSGLLAGILVGIGIGLLVQSTWGRLVNHAAVPMKNGV
jgi:F0F1-type ATP synthase assembly protein I